jgi:tyrosinase
MEDFNLFSRRDFLKDLGAFSAVSLAFWTGGCESCIQQIQNLIQNRPTRKNIQTLWAANPSDPVITTYKNAVKAMKALPSTDQRSWQAQANIHYNFCTHSNWLWLPWHRAYLLYFERICRKLTGDDGFALPYWNWNTHPAVPDPFWDTSSPLYDSTRCITQTDQADSAYIGTAALQPILSEPNFNLFASGPPPGSDIHSGGGPSTGMLEGTPHNYIHGFVGSSFGCLGDMGAFHSPLDPVFWTHHCMLDCLWAHWNNDLGNANTNDPSWVNYSFTNFFDENGNPVTISVATTVLLPILTYQYEPCSLLAEQGSQKIKLQGKQLEEFLRAGAPSKLEFVRRFELRQSLIAEVGKPATGALKVEAKAFTDVLQGDPKNRAVLTVADVDIPEQRDFFVRVFIDKPDASVDTPITDPHYAGSFGFFFDETTLKTHQGEHAMSATSGRPQTGYLIDVTPTLQRLNQAGSMPSDQVEVSFVVAPFTHGQSKGHLTLQRLELGVARF